MSTVLLLLAPDRHSPAALAEALDLAVQSDAELCAVYIIDPDAAARVSTTVGQTGFVPETTCEALCASIQDSYEQRGREVLAVVEAAALARGRVVSRTIATGSFVDIALGHIAQAQPTHVLVARRPGSRLRRFVRGSDVDALQDCAPCPIIVFDAAPGGAPADEGGIQHDE